MQKDKNVFQWRIYIKKKIGDLEKVLLSRNHDFIAIPSIGIIACVVSCGLIAIGLIVGTITKCVRSKKQKENNAAEMSTGNRAVQQDIEQTINQTKVERELTIQNVNNFKSIQNTQEVINLNSLNNNMKIGL
jgi:hypothetical protein